MLRCPPPATVEITPTGPLRATIRPPGSKAITSRALLCAALAQGDSLLVGALNDDDTRGMIDGLRRLGIGIDVGNGGTRLAVAGCGGHIPASRAQLNVPRDSTTMGFLAAATSLGVGSYRFVDATPGHDRSLRDLLAAFEQLGVEVRCENGPGRPHLRVNGHGLQGGTAKIGESVSSHLLSGLLLVAPLARQDIHVRMDADHAFQQQIIMTLAVMRAFEVYVPAGRDLRQIDVDAPQVYRGRRYDIEPDASAATHFWAAAAITRGMITVEGLSLDALQSNVAFCNCLQRMGCRVDYGPHSITVAGHRLKGIDVEIGALRDNWQVLAAVALFAEGPTTITGLSPATSASKRAARTALSALSA